MALMTPAPTAESHLRNVLQAVQGVLDLAEGPEAVTLSRLHLERWQALLVLALEALAAPASCPRSPSPTSSAWGILLRKRRPVPMTEGQKDRWAGILLTVLVVGLLLGGLLLLRLTGN